MWCQCWHHITLLHLLALDDQNEMQHDLFSHLTLLVLAEHHTLPMELSIAPLHSLGEDNWNNVQDNFLLMGYHWCWHQYHMIPTVSSVLPFYLLGQDDRIEMQYHLFWSCDATGTSMWFQWHLLGQDNWNEVQHDFSGHVIHLVLTLALCNAGGIVNSMTALLAQDPYIKVIKMRCNMNFLVMWHYCHWHWHHVILMASPMVPLHSLGQDKQNEVQQTFWVM